jgi:hypothetical protein
MTTAPRAAFLAALVLVLAPSPTRAAPFYDVSFEAPLHVLGAEPTLVSESAPFPRHAPTGILVGPWTDGPRIVQGPNGTQETEFRYTGPADPTQLYVLLEQLIFAVDGSSRSLAISFDLDVASLAGAEGAVFGGEFSVAVDTPFTHSFDFRGDGFLDVVQGGGGGTTAFRFATYPIGSNLHVQILSDLDAATWSLVIDGAPLFTGSFIGSAFDTVRFSLRDFEGSGIPTVYLDNVSIVPEPSSTALLAVVVAAGAALRGLRKV